jgi:hypothetical protein
VAFEPGELDALQDALEALQRRNESESVTKLIRLIKRAALERTAAVMLAGELRVLLETEQAGHVRLESIIDQLVPELAFPSNAAVLQARRNAQARTELLQEFGALTGEQIAEERSKAKNRHALAARWRKEGRILGVPYRGQTLYPAFQFDDAGELRPVIRAALAKLPRDRMSDWEVALWWAASNGWLGGLRPVDLLDETDVDDIVAAAGRLAETSPL